MPETIAMDFVTYIMPLEAISKGVFHKSLPSLMPTLQPLKLLRY
jgi:hypothetical protein